MKKIFVVIAICSLLGLGATASLNGIDRRPMAEQFEQAMCNISFDTYTDSDFNYSFSYPAFFQREEEEGLGVGHVVFSYHGHTDLVLECKVVPESCYQTKRRNFIIDKALPHQEGYRVRSHFVLRDGCWYVLSLSYHEDFKQAVCRIIRAVDTWDTNMVKKLKLPAQKA